MPMSEEEFTRALERAARALAGGDIRAWREAMGDIGAHASDEQWARAVRRVWGCRARGGSTAGPRGTHSGRAGDRPALTRRRCV